MDDKNAKGGEIIVPKAPSMKILDLAKVIAKEKIKIIGKRPGEKISEELISIDESINTIDLGKYYAILPSLNFNRIFSFYKEKFKIKKFSQNNSYNSENNDNFLSQNDIRQILKKLKSEI